MFSSSALQYMLDAYTVDKSNTVEVMVSFVYVRACLHDNTDIISTCVFRTH